MSSKIPKITAKTSNLAPRWPPRAPNMAPETSNLVQQSSEMPPEIARNLANYDTNGTSS